MLEPLFPCLQVLPKGQQRVRSPCSASAPFRREYFLDVLLLSPSIYCVVVYAKHSLETCTVLLTLPDTMSFGIASPYNTLINFVRTIYVSPPIPYHIATTVAASPPHRCQAPPTICPPRTETFVRGRTSRPYKVCGTISCCRDAPGIVQMITRSLLNGGIEESTGYSLSLARANVYSGKSNVFSLSLNHFQTPLWAASQNKNLKIRMPV